jgi:hypothetical protein
MPRRVRIGPHWWRIERGSIPGDPNAYGLTLERALRILIAGDCHRSQDRETLLHELLHAAWTNTALDQDHDAEAQERIVASLAPWLLGTLRDNPALVGYLTGK